MNLTYCDRCRKRLTDGLMCCTRLHFIKDDGMIKIIELCRDCSEYVYKAIILKIGVTRLRRVKK